MNTSERIGPYKYGDGTRTAMQIVRDAAMSFDSPTTQRKIYERVIADIPDFKESNMFPDLSALTVNCNSRSNYSGNNESRRSDTGNEQDKLFRIYIDGEAFYVPYDATLHGVWMLVPDDKGKLRPLLIESAAYCEQLQALKDIEKNDGWSLNEDARRQVMALIYRREGQPVFRQSLLKAYDRKCAISGCDIEVLLEAAHIVPYKGEHTNHINNGLLLRADLHKLFDLRLIFIDPETKIIRMHDSLQYSDYFQFSGKKLRDPKNADLAPSFEALSHHSARCTWLIDDEEVQKMSSVQSDE